MNMKKWLGILLPALVILTVFLPGFSLSGRQYVQAALEANRYAFRADSSLQESSSLITEYSEDSASRSQFTHAFTDITPVPRIVQIRKWKNTQPDTVLDGNIYWKDGQAPQLQAVSAGVNLWNWMLLLPALVSAVLLIFTVCLGTLSGFYYIIGGAVSAACAFLEHLAVPGVLWNSLRTYAESFTLLSASALEESGTGTVFFRSLYTQGSGIIWILVLLFAVLVAAYGCLCMTFWRKPHESPEENSVRGGTDNPYNVVFEGHPADQSVTGGRRTDRPAAGTIRGISGEYAGVDIPVQPGEEIIFGRDPRFSMLVMSSQTISRRQCGIRYDSMNGCYQAIDYSTNGTRLSDGSILTTSSYTTLLPGTVLYMGNGSDSFMVM